MFVAKFETTSRNSAGEKRATMHAASRSLVACIVWFLNEAPINCPRKSDPVHPARIAGIPRCATAQALLVDAPPKPLRAREA
jgi:hypothetical protein